MKQKFHTNGFPTAQKHFVKCHLQHFTCDMLNCAKFRQKYAKAK